MKWLWFSSLTACDFYNYDKSDRSNTAQVGDRPILSNSLQEETFKLFYSQIRARFQFNVCDRIQVPYYDWWATVVRWLFMPFSLDFLVLPVKKSDMSVKYKRQLNLTHHKQRATKITCLVVHRDSHLIYKRYKVQKKIFNGPPRYTSINVHKTHSVFFFFGSTLGNAYFNL